MATTNPGLSSYLSTGLTTSAGITVSDEGVMALAAVYGCARVRCGTIGSLPLHVYKDGDKGREKAKNHPLYPLLHDSPNAYMNSMEWREAMQLGLDLRGNAYSVKESIGSRITALNFLRADRVTPKVSSDGVLTYEWQGPKGMVSYSADRILHLKNFSFDGINGLSPIGIVREVFAKALATQQYGSSFFRNGARPGGVLKHPKVLSPEARDKMRSDWNTIYQGSNNAGNIAILYEGMDYAQIAISPDDAQFIETTKMNVADIAAIYGVPLNMLGHSDKTATYASAEQFDIQFAKHTIKPLAVKWEQALTNTLIAVNSNHYCEFDMESLLRGDTASQIAFVSQAVQNGIMTRNEARRKFNLPDMEGGDDLTVQSNMIDIADLEKLVAAKNPAASGGPNAA